MHPAEVAAAAQTPPDAPWLRPRAGYIHVPFCAHHCGYCDFAVVAGRDESITAYIDALIRELATLETPRPIHTIFLGGGTPTYPPPKELERLLAAIRRWLPLAPGGEWSIESTPDSLDAQRVQVLADAGVNRVSIGIQSFHDASLKALDRRHCAAEIAPAIERVRQRIANFSLDLIFGVPGQTLDDWRDDLMQALTFAPDHMSCYGLTFEKGTGLWREWQAGKVAPLDEEIEREMLLLAHDELPGQGYEHYEISNYARPGQRCRHNETYWANHAYFGFGMGAARYVDGRRELNTRSLTDYISRIAAGRPATIQSECLDDEERARETITVQLRRRDGINRSAFVLQSGIALDDLAGEAIARHVAGGLLADDGERVFWTREGLCVVDSVLADLWQLERIFRIPLAEVAAV